MKNFPLTIIILISSFILNSCSKEIKEPEQKADGSNVVYLRIDNKEEYLLDARSKIFHKNTASDIENMDQSGVSRYSETYRNNRLLSVFTLNFKAEKPKKAAFQEGYIKLEFDKLLQVLDTSFVRNRISPGNSNAINFLVSGDNPRRLYVDSIIDYKIIKWDTENKTLTFSANGTYNLASPNTPANPKIYFYLDIKY